MNKLLITAYMPCYVVYPLPPIRVDPMWIRLKSAGGVVNRQHYGREEKSDPHCQGNNQRRLYKGDEGIHGGIDLPLVELGKALQDVAELAGLFPYLEHLEHYCGNFARIA